MNKCGKIAILFMVLAGILSCGVKGDPVPPMTPAEIGSGKPLFKGEDDESMSPLKKTYNPEDEKNDDQETEEE